MAPGGFLDKVGEVASNAAKSIFTPRVASFEKRQKEHIRRLRINEDEAGKRVFMEDLGHLPRRYFGPKAEGWKQTRVDLEVLLMGKNNVKGLENDPHLSYDFRPFVPPTIDDKYRSGVKKDMQSMMGDKFPDFDKSSKKSHRLDMRVSEISQDVANMQEIVGRLQTEMSANGDDIPTILTTHPEIAADMQKIMQYTDLMKCHEKGIERMKLSSSAVENIKTSGWDLLSHTFWKGPIDLIKQFNTLRPFKLIGNVATGIAKYLGLIAWKAGKLVVYDIPASGYHAAQSRRANSKITHHPAKR